MESTVGYCDLKIHHRITGKDATSDGFLDAIDDGGDIFLGNRAANDLIFDFDAFATFVRFENDYCMAVLTAASRLADELAFALCGFRNSLAISDLRRSGIGADPELAEQAVSNNFHVQFAHP